MFENIRLPQGLEAQRLFHGRGHAWQGYEHVCIDWYNALALITLYRESDDDWIQQLSQWLTDNAGATAVVVQYRCRQGAPFQCRIGEMPDFMEIQENGLKYGLYLNRSQNTGLFLDMANGRRWVQAHCDGRRVLNLFAYTCAFSVAAVAGGASKVVNVDMSRAALSHGRDNHRLNNHDLSKVVFEGVDIFRSFGRLKKHGPYELLISDPPSFQKGSVDIRKDYAKLLRRIPELVVPGGDLLLCLNAPELDEHFLQQQVAEFASDCVLVERIHAPEVFIEAQAGKGLKVFHYRYQPQAS